MNHSYSSSTPAGSEAFGEALAFSREDLQDNRSGFLSAGQRQRLASSFRRDMLLIWGGLLLISAVALRPDRWLLAGRPPDDRELVAIVLIAILWLTTLVATAVAVYRHRRDMQYGRVAQASGPIRLSIAKTMRRGNVKNVYRVSVGGETLTIPLAVYSLLADGEERTLFFTTYTKKVVAIL